LQIARNVNKKSGNIHSSHKRVAIVTVDQWMDKLHGASILDLMGSLSNLGYDLEVLVGSQYNRTESRRFFSIMAFKVKERIPVLPYFSFLARVTKHLVISKPDIVVFDFLSLPCFLCLKTLAKKKGILLIFSRPIEEIGLSAHGLLSSLQFRISLIIGRIFVDYFTAISPFEAASFSKLSNITMEKIVIVPSPLGESFIGNDILGDTDKYRVSLKLNALLGKIVFLYHGVLDEHRDVMRILELFASSSNHETMVLLVVGNGPAENSIKTFIQRMNANIVFLDSLPYSDMPNLIAACDVGVVLLPDNQNFRYQIPTKLIEFLALGKPVLASNLAGIRWAASSSSNVVYVESLERVGVNDFKMALQRVLEVENDGHSSLLSHQKSRQIVIDKFSSHSIAIKLSRIIDSFE
jgi:glycosyltransferase involved in cell wall biosynthesis